MTVRRLRVEGHDGDHMMWAPEGGMHMTPSPSGEGHYRFFSEGPDGPDFMRTMHGGPMGLELATVNAGLGEYFGAKSGALVLEVPSDSTIQLKAGDVIVAIDGRAVTSEEQARRILRSYAEGETAKIEVMRQKKKSTVTWKAADADMMKRRIKVRVREGGPETMKIEVEKD
jgi:S1-C subfamily serine protease